MTDVKTARDVLTDHIFVGYTTLEFAKSEADAQIAALAAAGYQITPVRADDAIAWFWREKDTGKIGMCTSEKHRVDTAASPNYEVFPVFAHPAADAVAGAGRDADALRRAETDARAQAFEEAVIACEQEILRDVSIDAASAQACARAIRALAPAAGEVRS